MDAEFHYRYLYYKRVDPYLWTELAPVLEGSVSCHRYPRKGTGVDRVCVVFVARVDRRTIETTPSSGANTPLSQCHAWLGATQYSAACQTYIRCTLNWTPVGRQAGREAGKE